MISEYAWFSSITMTTWSGRGGAPPDCAEAREDPANAAIPNKIRTTGRYAFFMVLPREKRKTRSTPKIRLLSSRRGLVLLRVQRPPRKFRRRSGESPADGGTRRRTTPGGSHRLRDAPPAPPENRGDLAENHRHPEEEPRADRAPLRRGDATQPGRRTRFLPEHPSQPRVLEGELAEPPDHFGIGPEHPREQQLLPLVERLIEVLRNQQAALFRRHIESISPPRSAAARASGDAGVRGRAPPAPPPGCVPSAARSPRSAARPGSTSR